MSENIIELQGLTRKFEYKTALENITLSVPKGGVFGLVGENGAGKTTLIRHLLGLLRPHGGTVRVFGLDPVKDPVGVLSKIGYLSEDRDLIDWMRVDELMRFTQAFYPDWDEEYAQRLLKTFGLAPIDIVKNLSRGQRAQMGLLVAVSHHPDLLLLDEPSSGLDPIVRKDILSEIIHSVTEKGHTVFFSSHLLEEVERVSDRVAMISKGKLILSESMDEIKQSHKIIVVRFESKPANLSGQPGILSIEGDGKEFTILYNTQFEQLPKELLAMGGQIVEERIPSLTEIFIARVERKIEITEKV